MTKNSNRILSSSAPPVTLLLIWAAALAVNGQTSSARNNPYAPSPPGKTVTGPVAVTNPGAKTEVAFILQAPAIKIQSDGPANPSSSGQPVRDASRPISPMETYLVGIDDVLQIRLKNTPAGAGYYTIRADGTIDFPLAGDNVRVAGLTTKQIESKLAAAIKLLPNASVEVKIREYSSHKVPVSGAVQNPGEKFLQREAVPLFVIKAEAIVDAASTSVKISGAGQGNQKTYDLRDPKTDDILIYPGSSIEFIVGGVTSGAGSYFVTGGRVSPGERPLTKGLTLLRASMAANASAAAPKKAIIRRKNHNGIQSDLEFDLEAIKNGKIADPMILGGDIIEVRN